MTLVDRPELRREPPPVLYHYTNVNALLEIARTRCLHATHIGYLNDSAEVSYAFGILRQRLPEVFNGPESAELRESIEHHIDMLGRFNIFVASLSEQGDLLSQWRAYSKGPSGISVGFRSDGL